MKNMDSLVELLPRFNTDNFFSKTVTYFGERIVNATNLTYLITTHIIKILQSERKV